MHRTKLPHCARYANHMKISNYSALIDSAYGLCAQEVSRTSDVTVRIR